MIPKKITSMRRMPESFPFSNTTCHLP
jgi:hypothetical protein